MKQPDLGKKISELRKARGLTQEELVERCNVSVRTIQRIETGEVTPRSYTIKTILAALEYDYNDLDANQPGFFEKLNAAFRNLLLIDIDTSKPSGFLYKHLNLAWVFGVLYFISGFFDGTSEYFRIQENVFILGKPIYIIIKFVVLISFIFFMRGFIMMGGLFKNYLLKIITVLLVGANVLLLTYDIISVFYDAVERSSVLIGASLSFGGIGIIFGVALIRLKKYLGAIAVWAGVFEIIAAGFFLTVLLSFVGFIVLIPAELFEIILIFKAIHLLKEKEKQGDIES